MRFGTFHLIGAPNMEPAQQRFDDTIAQAALADELGYDYVWVAEHHFSNYGYSVNPLLVIAKASAVAPRVRFGQAVIVTPFWHPLRLAEDVAVTDLLTGGRFDLGVGRGYQHMEFEGLDLPIDASREMFVEQMELMRRAWTEDDITFEGRHFRVPRPITVLPRPAQQPHPPIWMAVQSPTSLDWAADHGYRALLSGNSQSPNVELSEWIERYRNRWVEAGHPEGQIRIGLLRFVYVSETEEQAREAVWQTRWQRRLAAHLRDGDDRIVGGRNEPYPFEGELSEEEWWDRLVYGPPERCIAQLRRDADLGITDALGWYDIGGLPGDEVLRSMRRFACEVMPALSGALTG